MRRFIELDEYDVKSIIAKYFKTDLKDILVQYRDTNSGYIYPPAKGIEIEVSINEVKYD